MRSDDLVPLLVPPPMDGLGFRQGMVVTFNTSTGANTIDVGGTTLVDVPMLNSGEAIALKAGHVVALLTWKSSWWILGRVTLPGSAQFASASVDIRNIGANEGGFTLNTSQTVRASAQITPPAWADKATVMCIGHASADNTTAVDASLYARTVIEILGGTIVESGTMASLVKAGMQDGHVSASNHAVLTGLSAGDLKCSVRVFTQTGTWTGNRSAIVTATAFFQATD